MKILHIISDTVLGGAQKVCIDLANCACQDGNTVAVAAMKGGWMWGELDANIKQYHLEHMHKNIIPKEEIKVLGELKKIRKEFRPDIIHLHTAKPGTLGRIAFFKDRKHIVYTIHGFDIIRVGHKKFLFLEKLMQKMAGAIVPISKYDQQNLLKEKISARLTPIIYNGLNSQLIQAEKSFPVKIKEKHKVATIARIAPPKDFNLFCRVAEEFVDKDTAFIWMGGSSELSVEEVLKKYDAPKNVYLLGDVPNASRYIKPCDIFVLFSDFEGLPISILEAMSQKKALVASDTGGIPELVDQTNGALIHNKEEAVEEIQKLLDDKKLLNAKSKASLEKFNEYFTIDKMWGEYKKLYLELNGNE